MKTDEEMLDWVIARSESLAIIRGADGLWRVFQGGVLCKVEISNGKTARDAISEAMKKKC